MQNMKLDYDKERKQIIIPFIDENDKITNKKIIYQFDGNYFVHG